MYRAVSLDELWHIKQTGGLASGPGSLSDKWFAERREHAVRWGELLNGPGNYRVIEVIVAEEAVSAFFRIERLDGIGPARYADVEQLVERYRWWAR